MDNIFYLEDLNWLSLGLVDPVAGPPISVVYETLVCSGGQLVEPTRGLGRPRPPLPTTREFLEQSEHTSGRIFRQDHGYYKEVYGIKAAHFFIIYVFFAEKFNQKSILTFCKLCKPTHPTTPSSII